MTEFVLHSSSNELARSSHTANGWIEEIAQIHSKGFCDTFLLIEAWLFETKCQSRPPKHHAVGPILELTSVGQKRNNEWQHAGWLCTLIESERKIQSLCSNPRATTHGEYSIYTGVHIVAENCLHPLETLSQPIEYFLKHQAEDPDSDWVGFHDPQYVPGTPQPVNSRAGQPTDDHEAGFARLDNRGHYPGWSFTEF